MLNKFTFLIASALACGAAATAVLPEVQKVVLPEELTNTLSLVTTSFSTDGSDISSSTSTTVTEQASLDPAFETDAAQPAFTFEDGHDVSPVSVFDGEPTLSIQDVARPSSPLKAPSKVQGNVVTGTLITKDLSTLTSTNVNYRLNLSSDTTSTDPTAYILTGIYGTTTEIKATINAEAGTITIPCQTIASVSAGDIKICPLDFTASVVYSDGDIVGTIDANGKITLGGWALMFLEGSYAGRGYNFFYSSEWIPANASATATNITSGEDVSFGFLVEQENEKSLTLYGLSGVAAEQINARLTSSKSVIVPNSYVYTNTYYGDFYLYPYNTSTNKVVAGTNLVGTYADNKLSFEAWGIAARASNTTIAYKYQDIVASIDYNISWPTNTDLNLSGEGTADDPFIITTAGQLQDLAWVVASGLDYEGDYFALGGDIDLTSVTSSGYLPIGESESAPFKGSFDGKGHTISGLSISDYAFTQLGLFGYIGKGGVVKNFTISGFNLSSTSEKQGAVAGTCAGTIENVTVTASKIVGGGAETGGIVGYLDLATVSNCTFQGYVSGPGSVGGIAGYAVAALNTGASVIKNCQVRANIYQEGYYSSTRHYAGGIVGYMLRSEVYDCSASGLVRDTYGYSSLGGITGSGSSSSVISRCLSTAMIMSSGNSTIGNTTGTVYNCYLGGIIGWAYNCKEISDCYSSSLISQSNTNAGVYTGGIVGFISAMLSSTGGVSSLTSLSYFKNCYFTGQVISSLSSAHKNIYGSTTTFSSWTGDPIEKISISNCYYDSQVATRGGDEYGLTTAELTSSLPEGFSADVWQQQAGCYPTLKSLAGLQSSEIASAPLLLTDGQTSSKVSKNFAVTPSTNVKWYVYDSTTGTYAQETDALAISGSNVTIKDQYSTSILAAISADGWNSKLYYLQIVPKWFDGEGTADDPYQLKSADDFVKLNTAVYTYGQSHSGDFFKVINDIDFADSSFNGVAVGSGSKSFAGTLDGNGKTIHNLNINGIVLDEETGKTTSSLSTSYVGLFGSLGQLATVKDLTIAADCSFKGYYYVGGIAGFSAGRIENCRNYAPINAASSYSGGITGVNYTGSAPDGSNYTGAVISKCYNAGAIKGSYSYHAGIAGASSGLVELSQNDGEVTATSNSADTESTTHNTMAGIVGYNNGGSVDRCVNNATITAYSNIGGIVAYIYSVNGGKITSSINNGVVNCISEVTTRGGVLGYRPTSGVTLANNYFDSAININGGANNVEVDGITGLDSYTLTNATSLEGISADDFDLTAGSYPVLKAFANETATKALRSIVASFNGVTRDNVSANVSLSKEATWSLTDGSAFKIVENTLTIPSSVLNVVNDTLNANIDSFTKVITIRNIPKIFEGDGTAESPYLIKTPTDWNNLADFMANTSYEYSGEYFRLENDIDFDGDSIRVVGVSGVKFDGIFNGNGKTIKNYVYNNPNSTVLEKNWVGPNWYRGANIGLFGTLGPNGTIKDLTVDGSFTGCTGIAGIVGDVYGVVENCVHNGSVATSTSTCCSGIANKVYDGGKILNCKNYGKVVTKTTTCSGIVYYVYDGGLVENCDNYGEVAPTTTQANGIAGSVYGTLRNCANHVALGSSTTTSLVSGICYTLGKTGKLENCYNEADLTNSAYSNVSGICYTTSDQTDETIGGVATSWLKNCYNIGNITAKSGAYGLVYSVKKGLLVEDCYNTGDITAAGTYNAFGLFGSISPNAKETQVTNVIRRCWNSGNVTGTTVTTTSVAGFAKVVSGGLILVEDCYNLGDVTSGAKPASPTSCAAVGFIGNISGGTYRRCWNAGNVTAQTPHAAGLFGYTYASAYDVVIEECFNLGDITGSNTITDSSKAANTSGTAAGLIGYTSTTGSGKNHIIRNCYNAGDVKGNTLVGGLIAGMTNYMPTIENCYNSGKVVCDDENWSGTIYTKADSVTVSKVNYYYFQNVKNLYYDSDITPGTAARAVEESAKSTLDMRFADLGDAFNYWHTYPVLKSFTENSGDDLQNNIYKVSTAMVAVGDGDSYSKVSSVITLAADPDVTWTTEGEGQLEIIGSCAYPRKVGKVTLTASITPKNRSIESLLKRSWELTIEDVVTGIEDLEADGKTVVKTLYVDPNGRIVTYPVAGQPYVVKITYDDGTSVVRKVVAGN